jgi:hypothetical protein
MEPKLNLNAMKIELLLRTALLDDAANPGERMGALLAHISVDDDNDAWISLDEDLWPENKEPLQAMAVAKLLGIELELLVTCMTFPFHWPGLAEHTNGTSEYVRVLLDAYDSYGGR